MFTIQEESRFSAGATLCRVAAFLLALSAVVLTVDLTAGASTQAADSSPRKLLRLAGIDDSRFQALVDDQPLDDAQRRTMLEILFRLSRFNNLELDNWTRREFDPASLKDGSEALRGEMFRLRGWVTEVEVRRLDEKTAELFDFPRYYRCKFILEGGQAVVVVALDVPKQWKKGGPIEGRLNQRATAQGLLLKLSADGQGKPVPLLLAQRVAWFPDTRLGNLGMDVGLLDGAAHNERITDEEREPFYQMLAAVGRAERGQLHKEARHILQETKRNTFSVVPLFNQPKEQVGKLFQLSGTARRVVKTRVDDPDIVSRFDIDHYFEIELFTSDSQSNPIVFCVRELPEGMPIGEGKDYRQQVSVAGFYFKKYGYSVFLPKNEEQAVASPSVEGEAADQPLSRPRSRKQLAPLLIGREPIWYPPEPPEDNMLFGAFAGGFFVLAMLCIWLAVWRYNRADTRFHKETIAKNYALDAGISLDEMDLEAEPEVDFNHLAAMDQSGPNSQQSEDKNAEQESPGKKQEKGNATDKA